MTEKVSPIRNLKSYPHFGEELIKKYKDSKELARTGARAKIRQGAIAYYKQLEQTHPDLKEFVAHPERFVDPSSIPPEYWLEHQDLFRLLPDNTKSEIIGKVVYKTKMFPD